MSRHPLEPLVAFTLAVVERDPLAAGARGPGELLRRLMEVPGAFWYRRPDLYDRYRDVVRRAALLRRDLPAAERMDFWTV